MKSNPYPLANPNPLAGGPRASRKPARGWSDNTSTVIALVAGLSGAGLVYLVTKSEIHLGGLAPFGFVAGVALLVQAARNWEFGLKSLLVVVIVEGAVRKWLLPS